MVLPLKNTPDSTVMAEEMKRVIAKSAKSTRQSGGVSEVGPVNPGLSESWGEYPGGSTWGTMLMW